MERLSVFQDPIASKMVIQVLKSSLLDPKFVVFSITTAFMVSFFATF